MRRIRSARARETGRGGAYLDPVLHIDAFAAAVGHQSKRRYLRFYRMFNRFRMKCFFDEALKFWAYSAPVCIIDNTNLARLRGTGKDAVIVPEMEACAKQYGFR